MLILITAIGIIAAGQASGSQALDYSRLVPRYALPSAFNAVTGERIRIASFVPPSWNVQDLIAEGISLFVVETDELGPPDSQEGRFEWKLIAAQRKTIEAQGADWGIGAYTTFPGSDISADIGEGAVHLQNGLSVPAWSPWNPERIRWSAVKLGALNRQFPKLSFVSVGVFGEYGDASLFTGIAEQDTNQVALWESKLGVSPPKPGFWSGDLLAKESWRRWLVAKYGSVPAAYRAWGMTPDDPGMLPIPVDASHPYVARLDYMDWYRSAIPSLVSGLSDIANEIFKESPILLPVGPPTDLPYFGFDAFRVAQAAKEKADALKVTNVGFYDFAGNWAMSLGRIRGAARAAGIPIWTEAPAIGTPLDFQERLFEALSLGSRGHIDWPQALRSNIAELGRIMPSLSYLAPVCDVAVLTPTSSHVLRPWQPIPRLLFRGLVELRDYSDFDVLEESAVQAGALASYRVLALFEGTVWNPRTLTVLRNWVESGGVLLAYDFGKMGDARGDTAVYRELFGFAAQLPRAAPTDRWEGEVPPSYKVDIGVPGDSEFLLGFWGPSAGGVRTVSNGAEIRLPAKRRTDLIVTVLFGEAPQPVKQLDFLVNGETAAGISLEGGIRQLRFAVDGSKVTGDTIRLGFAGLGTGESVALDAIIIAEADAEGPPAALAGRFEAPVPIETVRSTWSRPYGKGRAIFFPGRRDQWKQYINVIRHAIYRLSQIETGRDDAKLLDDKKDGVYITDLGVRLAAFNTSATDVTRRLPVGQEGAADVLLPKGKLTVISQEPPNTRLLIECETVEGGERFRKVELRDAGPGTGKTTVRVPAVETLSFNVNVPEDGRYRVYARTLTGGRANPVRFKVGGVESLPSGAGGGVSDLYLVGEFMLTEGEVLLELSSDRSFLADLVLLTDEPNVIGFRFARRRL